MTPPETIAAANRALIIQFMSYGTSLGILGGTVPVLSLRTGITTAELGVALTLFTVGYIAAMSLGGLPMRRWSRRGLMLAAIPIQALLLVLLEWSPTPLAFSVLLPVFAAGSGFIDLVMNADGAALERDAGRPLLSRMHGAASLGFALGAVSGGLLSAWGGTTVAAAAGVAFLLAGFLAIRAGLRAARPMSAATLSRRPPLSLPIVIIGLVVGINLAGETAVQMWSGRLLQDQAPDLVAYAGLGGAFFALFQAGPRLIGDRLRRLFGDRRLVTLSLCVSAVGFAAIGLSPGFGASVAGFAIVGVGTACVVPCCFAMAVAQRPSMAGPVLAAAAMIAGVPRIATPTIFGAVADALTIAAAFGVVAVALLAAVGLSLLLESRQHP